MRDLLTFITLDCGGEALVGTGPPGAGTGINGDFYIDAEAELQFGPKADGRWPKAGKVVNQQLAEQARAVLELRRFFGSEPWA